MPINNAIGIVQNTAKVPHGLPVSALTTTRARTASTMTQIRRMPTPAIVPATGPISARTMSPSERPSRRVDRKQHRHVLDRAGKHRAGQNPQRARQVPHLGGKHGTDQWTRACNRREVMAKEHVPIGRDVIETVVMAVGGRWPRAIDAERLLGHE